MEAEILWACPVRLGNLDSGDEEKKRDLASSASFCVTLGKLLKLSEPRFPIYHRDDERTPSEGDWNQMAQ